MVEHPFYEALNANRICIELNLKVESLLMDGQPQYYLKS